MKQTNCPTKFSPVLLLKLFIEFIEHDYNYKVVFKHVNKSFQFTLA